MLKGIDPLISPDLLYAIAQMGHGDEILFADANFPAVAKCENVFFYSGYPLTDILKATLTLFPLDYAVDYSAVLMAPTAAFPGIPEIWSDFEAILSKEEFGDKPFLKLEKPDYYERSQSVFCAVLTGERRRFSNIILRKGVITQ